MNTEYEIWNLMYLGFISNAMFMVAMVLLSWLGFRFAAAIAADPETPVMGKITATIFDIPNGIPINILYNIKKISSLL